jgi:hypothetical protein
MSTDTTPAALSDAASAIDSALGRLDEVLQRLTDGDLHRASPGGGWTVAQVVSHINLSALVWLGDVERLRQDPEPDLGTKTVADWFPIIAGHLTGHADQAVEILRSRNALPEGF